MKTDPDPHLPMAVFRFSINYLGILFAALLVDHYTLPIREALQSALY